MSIMNSLLKPCLKAITGLAITCVSTMAQSAGLLTPVGTNQPLEMISHDVDVSIQDGFVTTTVEQVFSNPSPQVLDALYRFPIPNHAAVGQFTYWINGQPVHGEVLEKQQARNIVTQEKQAGRKVAVTEQDSFKHFDIQVAQLQPGEDARIKLVYLQSVEMDHGIGRYVYPLEDGGTDAQQQAFWTMQSAVKQDFSFNVHLRSGLSVDAVRLPNHPQALIRQISSQEWEAKIHSSTSQSPNNPNLLDHGEKSLAIPNTAITSSNAYQLDSDIVFYWRLPQGTPGALDVLAYKADKHSTGTVMMTLTPADDVKPIYEGTDWTLVLDISGSMGGKFHTLIEGVKKGLAKFNVQDRVRIILFNNGTTELTNGFEQATQENLKKIINKLEATQPNGGTNLMSGVKLALSDLNADRTSAIWLVTDGVANVGETAQKTFLEVLAQKDIRLFTFIMGNNANRPLLYALSKASNGFAINVSNSDDILGQLEKAASKVTHEALHDIKIKFNGLTVKDIQPKEISSLYRGQQLQLFGHYWKGGKGELVVTAKRSGQKVEYKIPVELPETDSTYPELERLWAYSQIQDLMYEQDVYGETADRKDAVIDIAKEYSLVTPYTSMLVLEEEQFKQYGIERKNSQRIAKENQAQQEREHQVIVDRNQASNHPVISQPRANLGGGSGGAIDWKWLLVVGWFVYSRRKFRKFMS